MLLLINIENYWSRKNLEMVNLPVNNKTIKIKALNTSIALKKYYDIIIAY